MVQRQPEGVSADNLLTGWKSSTDSWDAGHFVIGIRSHLLAHNEWTSEKAIHRDKEMRKVTKSSQCVRWTI